MKSLFGINIGGGNCEICGSTLNALNSVNVDKRFICKKCISNVSRYYDRQNTSYESMIQHIRHRLENKKNLEAFSANISYGENEIFYFDEINNTFIIASMSNYKNNNPDIFNVADVINLPLWS